jgi:hypothetical protein
MKAFSVCVRMTINTTLVINASNEAQAQAAFYEMSPEEALSRACGEDKFAYDFDAEVTSVYPHGRVTDVDGNIIKEGG